MSDVIGTIRASAAVVFESSEAYRVLNLHWYGTPHCNRMVDGRMEPMEHENRALLESAHNEFMSRHSIEVAADLHADGRVDNFRVIKKGAK